MFPENKELEKLEKLITISCVVSMTVLMLCPHAIDPVFGRWVLWGSKKERQRDRKFERQKNREKEHTITGSESTQSFSLLSLFISEKGLQSLRTVCWSLLEKFPIVGISFIGLWWHNWKWTRANVSQVVIRTDSQLLLRSLLWSHRILLHLSSTAQILWESLFSMAKTRSFSADHHTRDNEHSSLARSLP